MSRAEGCTLGCCLIALWGMAILLWALNEFVWLGPLLDIAAQRIVDIWSAMR